MRYRLTTLAVLVAMFAGNCFSAEGPGQGEKRLFFCEGQVAKYQVIADLIVPPPAECRPYTGRDDEAIAIQADSDARIEKQPPPDEWVSLNHENHGCHFYMHSLTISGPSTARRGGLVATCDRPIAIVEGFAVRSLEFLVHADCARNLFSNTTFVGREGNYGGQIRTWQAHTLVDHPLEEQQPGTLGFKTMHALCKM